MESSVSRVVRFGVFEIDRAEHVLRKSGARIKLQDQPFRVLQILVERPSELITREELRGRLWPEDTFVEFDASLNTAIQKIRQALGDSAGSARFIETIPRLGYKFVAPVEDTPTLPEQLSSVDKTEAVSPGEAKKLLTPIVCFDWLSWSPRRFWRGP